MTFHSFSFSVYSKDKLLHFLKTLSEKALPSNALGFFCKPQNSCVITVCSDHILRLKSFGKCRILCFIWAKPLKNLLCVKVQKQGWTTSWIVLFWWIIICCMREDYRLKAFSVWNCFCHLVRKQHIETKPIWYYFAFISLLNIVQGHRNIQDELILIILCKQTAFWMIYVPIWRAFCSSFPSLSSLFISVICNLGILGGLLIFKLLYLSHQFRNCLFPFKKEKQIITVTDDSLAYTDPIA